MCIFENSCLSYTRTCISYTNDNTSFHKVPQPRSTRLSDCVANAKEKAKRAVDISIKLEYVKYVQDKEKNKRHKIQRKEDKVKDRETNKFNQQHNMALRRLRNLAKMAQETRKENHVEYCREK